MDITQIEMNSIKKNIATFFKSKKFTIDKTITPQLYRVIYNNLLYILKITRSLYKVTNPTTFLYEGDSLFEFTVGDSTCRLFEEEKDFKSLETFIVTTLRKEIQPCYLMDEYRWTLIYHLIMMTNSIYRSEQFQINLFLTNIMVNINTLEIKLIIVCDDCSELGATYPYSIHWTQVGLLTLYILEYHRIEKKRYVDEINQFMVSKKYNEKKLTSMLESMIVYPNCSLHVKKYKEFCNLFLIHCFTLEGYQHINFDNITEFYNNNYNRSEYFVIKGEGYGTLFYGILYKRIFEHIITHAFPNKNIVLLSPYNDKDILEDFKLDPDPARDWNDIKAKKKYIKIITMEKCKIKNQLPLPLSLVIRGSHYWKGPNCKTPDDVNSIQLLQKKLTSNKNKLTILKETLPRNEVEIRKQNAIVLQLSELIEKACKPSDPYQDEPYSIPYLSISCEPLRCGINPFQLPIGEINTITKQQIDTLDPYDKRLMKEQIWWGNQLYYFDSNSILSPNYTPNYWIPFLSHYYIDTIPFNSEHELFNLNPEIKQTVKTTDFMFMASNCTSTIRNELFLKLQSMDPFGDVGELSEIDDDFSKSMKLYMEKFKLKRVKSYGSCLRNMTGPSEKEKEPCHAIHNITINNDWSKTPCIYSESKFTLTFENSLNPGYITEKIMTAFQAGSIPIYYGPPEIKEIFNPNCFYYINDRLPDKKTHTKEDIEVIANELWALANDDTMSGWKKYLVEPIFSKVPDIFLYKTSTWMESIINDIQRRYKNKLDSIIESSDKTGSIVRYGTKKKSFTYKKHSKVKKISVRNATKKGKSKTKKYIKSNSKRVEYD